MDDVEQRGYADQIGLIVLGLDRNRPACSVPRQNAVGQDAVLVAPHTGHQRRVIRPGDRWVDDAHAGGRYTFTGQSTDVRDRGLRIIQQIGGKTVDTDDNDVLYRLFSRQYAGGT